MKSSRAILDKYRIRSVVAVVIVFSAIVWMAFSFQQDSFVHEGQYSQSADSLTVEGRRLAARECVSCHTSDLIASQRLTKVQWARVFTKMIGWGSTFDTTKKEILLDFLSIYYDPLVSDSVRNPLGIFVSLSNEERAAMRRLKGSALRGKKLYTQLCAVCHENPAEGVASGTLLENNPILDDDELFWDVVLNGRMEMPAFRNAISNQAASDILASLRTSR